MKKHTPIFFYNNIQRMASPNLPSNCSYFNNKKNKVLHRFCYSKSRNGSFPARVSSSSALLILSLRDGRRSWRLYANAELPVLVDGSSKISHTNAQSPIVPSVEIPVTCYQVISIWLIVIYIHTHICSIQNLTLIILINFLH